MGQIYLYNSLDTKKNIIRASGRLRDILPGYDFSKAVVLNNGNRIDPDFMVGEDDSVFIRAVPQGATLTVVAIVVSVIAAAAAIGTSIYAAIQNQRLEDELKKAQKQSAKQSNEDPLPFLKGAKNQSALGKDIPFVMGEMFNTPYKLYAGHYTLGGENGSEQYWHAVLCNGFGEQIIKSVSVGDVKVLDLSEDTSPQNESYSIRDGIYAAPQNIIEIRNHGEFADEELRQKILAVPCGDEVVYGSEDTEPTPLIKQIGENAMAVDVEIEFNGLRRMDDKGNFNPKSVEVVPSWSNDNGTSWHDFTFNQSGKGNTFEYNTSKTIRFIAHYDFSPEESYGKSIQIKLIRKTKKNNDTKSQDTVTLGYYQTYCYDPKQSSMEGLVPCPPLSDKVRDKTTRIGLRLVANDSTKDEINEINVICRGVARTWDGYGWSTVKSFTRNPAAWALEVLTSDTHIHSRFNDSEIDLESFGALYEYCEEQELYCDGVVTKGTKKMELVGKILSECFSTLIRNKENRLEVCIDREESIPVGLINSQSVISSTVTKSFERQIDGKKVTFVNRDNWQTDTMYVMRDGSNVKGEEQTATEIAMNYVTTPNHAWKIAQRQLLKASLQPREIKINVGREGDYYPLYSTLKVQLPQMRIGNVSTVLHSIDTERKRIELADYVTFEGGKTYGLIIEARSAKGKIEYDIPVSGSGTTNIVNYAADYDFDFEYIQYGNLVSFGELQYGSFEKVTNVMKIMGIDTADDGVQLTLRDYSPAIYRWERGEPIPEFKSNITAQNNSFTPAGSIPLNFNYVEQQLSFVRTQASADTDAKIEAAQLKGSPMYTANINTAVIRKLSETDYSPSTIEGTCTKQAFNDRGEPVDPLPNPCDWTVTVNDQFTVVYPDRAILNISLTGLIEQIKVDEGLPSLNLRKINIKATSVNNPAVVWDEENIVVISNDGFYVFELENEYQVYECYSEVDGVTYPNGYIKTGRDTFITPHLYFGLTELSYGTDWTYEVIPPVPGFDVSLKQSRALDGTLVIHAREGADMELEGSIRIPVFIRTSSTIEIGVGFTDGAGTEIAIGYSDAGGNEYSVGYLMPDENSGIILLSFSWSKLIVTARRIDAVEKSVKETIEALSADNFLSSPEKRSVFSIVEKIKTEYNFNKKNYSRLTSYGAYNDAYNALMSYIEPMLVNMSVGTRIDRTEFTGKFNAYYSALEVLGKEISDTPTYTFVTDQRLPSNPKYGDFFLCGSPWNDYKLGLIYMFNGYTWEESSDPDKLMTAMNDALSILSGKDVAENIPAVTFTKNLIAMNAVIKNLVTRYVNLQEGGWFKAGYNGNFDGSGKLLFNGTKGTGLDTYGNAEFCNEVHLGDGTTLEGIVKSKGASVLSPSEIYGRYLKTTFDGYMFDGSNGYSYMRSLTGNFLNFEEMRCLVTNNFASTVKSFNLSTSWSSICDRIDYIFRDYNDFDFGNLTTYLLSSVNDVYYNCHGYLKFTYDAHDTTFADSFVFTKFNTYKWNDNGKIKYVIRGFDQFGGSIIVQGEKNAGYKKLSIQVSTLDNNTLDSKSISSDTGNVNLFSLKIF